MDSLDVVGISASPCVDAPLIADQGGIHTATSQVNRRSRTSRRRALLGLAMATPALVVVALIVIVPLFEAAYYSLTTWNGLSSRFIGFSSASETQFGKRITTGHRED